MLIIFVEISSLIKGRMPPPWELLSYLNGGAYSSILNCAYGKEESSFVSKTIRMSMLSFTILDNISNLFLIELMFICPIHCAKSFQIRSFFWSIFSCIRIEYGDIRSMEYLSVFNPNVGKYGPEKTPNLDTFHAVSRSRSLTLTVTIH